MTRHLSRIDLTESILKTRVRECQSDFLKYHKFQVIETEVEEQLEKLWNKKKSRRNNSE